MRPCSTQQEAESGGVMDWTDEAIEKLVKMVIQGRPMSQIAAALGGGCTRNAAIGKWHRVSAARGLRTPTPRKNILEDVGESHRISPQLLCNTTPKRACEPHRAMLKVAKVGVGFLLPSLPKTPQTSTMSIIDVTGCRWPVSDEPHLPGGFGFCNGAQHDGSSYCEAHAREATAAFSNDRIRRTIKSALTTLRSRRAA